MSGHNHLRCCTPSLRNKRSLVQDSPPPGSKENDMSKHIARPNFRARSHAVAAGHYLAAMAGHDVLRDGGNAIDAAAAVAFCLAVLEPHQNGLGGECPMVVHFQGRTMAVSGQGTSPRGLTLDWFREQGISLIPGDGLLPATVPAHVGTWLVMLRDFGTMPLARVLEPAIDLAGTGFAAYPRLCEAIAGARDRFLNEWRSSAETFLRNGAAPEPGDRVQYPAIAETLRRLRNQAARKINRADGVQAAFDWFYKGPAAAAIQDFCASTRSRDATGRDNKGFLTVEDIGRWKPKREDPLSLQYRGVTVHKCGPWSQGPVFLQQLAILSGFDLAAMEQGSVEYLHLLIEAARLAFADREAYYGDPDFDRVPMAKLLSESYNAARRAMIDTHKAAEGLRPGDLSEHVPLPDVSTALPPGAAADIADAHTADTTHLDVVDRHGNCVSATPSGGWLMTSPVIPDLGFPLGTRGQMFYLDPARANCYAPGKRPRTTLSPSLATRDGRPWLVFGTPGGDGQDQWTLQLFLNIVEFGMTAAEAVEAPTVTVQSFPGSFYPRSCTPGLVACESRIPIKTMTALQEMGHEIEVDPAFAHGKPSVIRLLEDGSLEAAITSRAEIGYVTGW